MKNLFKIQLFLFIILLVIWNIVTPFLEGADESGHFCHADYISHRNKIPNLNIKDGCFLVYQPFYYLSLTPVVKAFNLPEVNLDDLPKNPNWNNLRVGEYAQYVHIKNELFFKWDKFQFLIHSLRFFSSLYAIVTFLVARQILIRIFKKKVYVYLSLAFFFNPMFLHISTTLTNVVLINLLGTAFIALDLLFCRRKKPVKISLLQGFIFGLGVLSKISIFQLSFAFVFIFIKKWLDLKESARSKFIEAAVFSSGVLLTAGWYMLRSFQLYGEVLEINIARSYAGEYHWTLLSKVGPLNFWHSFIDTIFRTFWSGYGALTINFPPIINTFILLVSLFTTIGAVKGYKHAPNEIKMSFYYAASAFIGLTLVNIRTSSMHAKDVFIAFLPISILFTFGLVNIKNFIAKKKLSSYNKLLIFTLSFYFLTREQILAVIKHILYKQGITASVLPTIIVKLVAVYFLAKVAQYLISSFKINELYIRNLSIILFLINAIIIAYSTYLFYLKFI